MPEPSPHVTSRLRRFGESIFTEVSRAAAKSGAINLGQGFPDFDGPDFVKAAAVRAINDGPNQYAPVGGLPILTEAIAQRFQATQSVVVDPATQVTVTPGCTGAIASAMLGFLEPGDEVLLLEPWYDSYPAMVEMAGAVCRYLRLESPAFRITRSALEAAITPATRMMVVNTPHNPTGRVLDDEELAAIEAVAEEHDLVVFSDEVYEFLHYDVPHRSLLTRPGLQNRTIVGSSIGKTFSLTGWKIGWTIASPELTEAVRAAHQFTIFSVATPLQVAAAEALSAPDEYFRVFRHDYRMKRDLLVAGLESAGLDVIIPEGTFFVLVDHRKYGLPDDRAFCRHLMAEAGVAAIPVSAFHHDGDEPDGGGRELVRFAFCKNERVLLDAISRLQRLQAGG